MLIIYEPCNDLFWTFSKKVTLDYPLAVSSTEQFVVSIPRFPCETFNVYVLQRHLSFRQQSMKKNQWWESENSPFPFRQCNPTRMRGNFGIFRWLLHIRCLIIMWCKWEKFWRIRSEIFAPSLEVYSAFRAEQNVTKFDKTNDRWSLNDWDVMTSNMLH